MSTKPVRKNIDAERSESDSQGRDSVNYEADVFGLVALAWREKVLILIVSLFGTLLAVAYALIAPEWYTARVVLSASTEQESFSFQGQLGGLASLAGLDLNVANSNEAKAILTSREFTGRFVNDKGLLPVLFVSDWNEEINDWHASDPMERPDVRDAIDYIEDNIRSIRDDASSGLLTLFITWKDPELAAIWANELVDRVNLETRNRAIKDSTANIDFLREELSKTNQLALQQSIGSVIESELQRLLLAHGNEQYAFKVIDHAEIPKYKSKPRRTLIVTTAALFSFVIGFLIVFVRDVSRKRDWELTQ